jgi:GMP synthase (glutamine-hydrolysing)
MRIAVVNHEEEYRPGRLASHLDRFLTVVVQATEGEFPADVEAAVVLGGHMGAYDVGSHPWLVEEKRWLAGLVDREIPVFGICLGSQLLADTLGGSAFLGPLPEIGVVDVHLTSAGETDEVVKELGDKALFAHRDTFELPPGATLLATTADYPAAFRVGSALALQSHPEAVPEEALSWADYPGFDLLEVAGVERDDYADQVHRHADDLAAAADSMFSAWFGALGDGARTPR